MDLVPQINPVWTTSLSEAWLSFGIASSATLTCSAGIRNGKPSIRLRPAVGRPGTCRATPIVAMITENSGNYAGGIMSRLADLRVRIFADGADYDGMVKLSRNPLV